MGQLGKSFNSRTELRAVGSEKSSNGIGPDVIEFRGAAEMLNVFGMHQCGSKYRRSSRRSKHSSEGLSFSALTHKDPTHHARFDVTRELQILYSRDPIRRCCRADENEIVPSDEFFKEAVPRSIPTTSTQRRRCRPRLPLWICLVGSPTAGSARKDLSECQSSVISVSRGVSLAKPIHDPTSKLR
jgi:hypothetical protein